MGQKKWIVLAAALGFMLAAVFSTPLAFSYLEHDCHGADCPVCALATLAQNCYKSLKILAALSSAGVPAVCALHRLPRPARSCPPSFTLHLLKVQFNT
jgi:hypothetical protein